MQPTEIAPPKRAGWIRRWLARLGLALGIAGCQMSLDSAASDAGSVALPAACMEAKANSDLAWIQANIFTPSCSFASCHGGNGAQADGLILTANKSHDQLVGQASVEQRSWTRVVAGDPDHSYLLVALGEEPGPLPKSGVMPEASPPLCDEKREAIRRWIAAGASP